MGDYVVYKRKLEREINSYSGYLRKDMKAFWDNQIYTAKVRGGGYPQWMKDVREAQGFYFWEHGAKQFVTEVIKGKNESHPNKVLNFKDYIAVAKNAFKLEIINYVKPTELLRCEAFLNCLGCFGEKYLEKLIKDEGDKLDN